MSFYYKNKGMYYDTFLKKSPATAEQTVKVEEGQVQRLQYLANQYQNKLSTMLNQTQTEHDKQAIGNMLLKMKEITYEMKRYFGVLSRSQYGVELGILSDSNFAALGRAEKELSTIKKQLDIYRDMEPEEMTEIDKAKYEELTARRNAISEQAKVLRAQTRSERESANRLLTIREPEKEATDIDEVINRAESSFVDTYLLSILYGYKRTEGVIGSKVIRDTFLESSYVISETFKQLSKGDTYEKMKSTHYGHDTYFEPLALAIDYLIEEGDAILDSRGKDAEVSNALDILSNILENIPARPTQTAIVPAMDRAAKRAIEPLHQAWKEYANRGGMFLGEHIFNMAYDAIMREAGKIVSFEPYKDDKAFKHISQSQNHLYAETLNLMLGELVKNPNVSIHAKNIMSADNQGFNRDAVFSMTSMRNLIMTNVSGKNEDDIISNLLSVVERMSAKRVPDQVLDNIYRTTKEGKTMTKLPPLVS